MKECPSCGNTVSDDQIVCPMCGTMLRFQGSNVKTANRELESMLFTCNSKAEVTLSKKLSAGIGGGSVFKEICQIELDYLDVIRQFPTESKAYIAYVEYSIKVIRKTYDVKNVVAYTQYTVGTENILARCRDYLQKAKEYASDAEMETILQLDSELTSEIETIANDPSIRQKHERARKINKGCLIGIAVFFGVLFLIWLIAASLGI